MKQKFRIQDPQDLKTGQSLKIQDLHDLTTKWMFKVQDAEDPTKKCQESWSTGSDSKNYKMQVGYFMQIVPHPGNVILSIWLFSYTSGAH